MKRIFTIIAITAAVTTFAQSDLGIQIGLNTSNVIDKQENPTKKFVSKLIPGLQIGIFTYAKIGRNLFLKPGLQYNEVGGKGNVEATGTIPAHEETQRFSYLSIPLTVHYTSSPIGFNIYAGAQLAFLTKQKVSANINGTNITDDPDMLKSTDFSLLAGMDYSFTIGIIIGLRSQLGISNVIRPEFVTASNPTVTNPRRTINNITISIGYIIATSKKNRLQ